MLLLFTDGVLVCNRACCYCSQMVFQYKWMQGPKTDDRQHRHGSCVMSNVRYMEAVSPAFLNEVEYNDTLYVTFCICDPSE